MEFLEQLKSKSAREFIKLVLERQDLSDVDITIAEALEEIEEYVK